MRGRGLDAVVAFVETHGRADTDRLLKGLEKVPMRQIEYAGVILEEMDVDAVLTRKPDVALIDDLAHTNLPGSRHIHRYQDAKELLAAGIDVMATIKIQNLESLADTVERIIREKIRERVPDSFFADAEEIVNVDLAVDDLLLRAFQGKIFVGNSKASSPDWFNELNLEILRELATRETPGRISRRSRVRCDEDPSLTVQPVIAFLPAGEPTNERILRYASTLAARLRLEWFALCEEDASLVTAVGEKRTRDGLSTSGALARELGATVSELKGEEVIEGLLRLSSEKRAGHIVLGTPTVPSPWARLMGQQSLTDRLMNALRGPVLIIVDTRVPEPSLSEKTGTADSSWGPTEECSETEIADLAAYVSPENIVILGRPVPERDVVTILARVASRHACQGGQTEFVRQVEDQASRASALPHDEPNFPCVCVDGLEDPAIYVGIAKSGISDYGDKAPMDVVFLILYPSDRSDLVHCLRAATARAARNESLINALKRSGNPEEAFAAIQDRQGNLWSKRPRMSERS